MSSFFFLLLTDLKDLWYSRREEVCMKNQQQRIVLGTLYGILSGIVWGLCGIIGQYFFHIIQWKRAGLPPCVFWLVV